MTQDSRLRTPVRALLIVTSLVLVGTACGGSGSDEVQGLDREVQPFSEVQASEFVFENDTTFPGRGIFRVTTTEPMICAIVWGETEALGNFNNSLDMNGTGIIDHNVFLPGAEPGRTYFYRVQGSTADGTLFSTELATFTLTESDAAAAPMEGAPHGENLAAEGTVVEASSEFGASWAAANAIDGDMSTEWSTSGDGDDGFITIDLGVMRDVAGVEFLTRSMANGTATTMTFWVVVDGGERLGPFQAGNPATPSFQASEFRGRLLTFEIGTSTGGNTGAVEIRVFAPDDTSGAGS